MLNLLIRPINVGRFPNRNETTGINISRDTALARLNVHKFADQFVLEGGGYGNQAAQDDHSYNIAI